MEPGRTVLTEAVRKVQLLKINGYSATANMLGECIKSKWNVDGHDWEVCFYPACNKPSGGKTKWVALKLIPLSIPQRDMRVNLSCRLVHPSQHLNPSDETSVCHVFCNRLGLQQYSMIYLITRAEIGSGFLVNDSLTVQCTITVLKELTDIVVPASNSEAQLPPSDLHRHLGKLWQGQRGTDVTFVLESGERFLAHKLILAARSPVFMAEFFGDMSERSSQSIGIEGIEAAVFKVMLHFIYTDRAPELDEEPEVAVTMAQHLLAAADRYGLGRLKLICESKLAGGISIETVATTLSLAEQRNCSLLKAKCVDFITRSPETLDAFLATEGYNHLVASCPLVLAELLRAAHGRRI